MSGGQRNRSFIRRFLDALDHLDREERGLPPVNSVASGGTPADERSKHVQSHNSQASLARTATVTTPANLLIPPNDKLLVFRALTGIDVAPALLAPGNHERTAPNVGLYTRVVRAEKSAAQRHRAFAILINTCLGIQIVVAAAVTALGAASGPSAAVTAFGAINTVMAGTLTYLKGSGLPDRMKRYQNLWRNIREYIEQRERELCLEGCKLDVQEEVITIEGMYDKVKQEVKATKGGGENRLSSADGGERQSFHPHRAVGSSKMREKDKPECPISAPEPSLEKH